MVRKSSARSVLLIDDSHEDLFLTKRLLVRAGIKQPIVTVDGGEEAMVFLRAAILPGADDLVTCVIFCDVKMPKLNGFDVLKWVRMQKPLQQVTFVVFSGGDVPEDRERAKQLGADHFLVKFPDPAVLKKIIDDCCGCEG